MKRTNVPYSDRKKHRRPGGKRYAALVYFASHGGKTPKFDPFAKPFGWW